MRLVSRRESGKDRLVSVPHGNDIARHAVDRRADALENTPSEHCPDPGAMDRLRRRGTRSPQNAELIGSRAPCSSRQNLAVPAVHRRRNQRTAAAAISQCLCPTADRTTTCARQPFPLYRNDKARPNLAFGAMIVPDDSIGAGRSGSGADVRERRDSRHPPGDLE